MHILFIKMPFWDSSPRARSLRLHFDLITSALEGHLNSGTSLRMAWVPMLVKGVSWLSIGLKGVDVTMKGAKMLGGSSARNATWIKLTVGGREFLTTRSTLLSREESTLFDVFVTSEQEVQGW